MTVRIECSKCRRVYEIDLDDPSAATVCKGCGTPLPPPAPADDPSDPLASLFGPDPSPPAADPARSGGEVPCPAAPPAEAWFGPSGADGRPRYELLEKIGEDAVGEFFRARDRDTAAELGVRLLPPKNGEQTAALERYMKKALSLQHPHILRLHASGRRGDRIFLVSDRFDGGSVAGIKDARQICAILRDAALGVQHAHQQGVFHGDLHPDNLLLLRDPAQDRVVVKDFRLAHALESLAPVTAGAAAFVRKPAFLSPEVADQRTKPLSAATDVYALGATLYALLAGKPPFEGKTTAQVLGRVMMEEPLAIEKVRPDVPEPLAAVIRRAMAKDTSLRFPTPKDLAEALGKVIQGCWPVAEPVPAPPGEPAAPAEAAGVEAKPAAAKAPEPRKPVEVPAAVVPPAAAPAPKAPPPAVAPAPAPAEAAGVEAKPAAAKAPEPRKPAEVPAAVVPPAAAPAPKAPPPAVAPAPAPAVLKPPPVAAPMPEPEPQGEVAPVSAPPRRRSWAWPAAAGGLLLLGTAAILFLRFGNPAPGVSSAPPPPPPPASAPPPAPAADPGVLEFDLAPVPQALRIDGQAVDATRKTHSVPPGRHQIEGVFENQVRLERVVEVAPGEIRTVPLRAHREIARSWEQKERWAEAERALLEGLGVAAGEAERRGLEEELSGLKARRLESQSVLRVESQPPGADLFLDGRPAGKTPVTIQRLKGGEHVLEFRLEGHVSETRRIAYEPGKSEAVRVELKPRVGLLRVPAARSGDVLKLLARDGREVRTVTVGAEGGAEFASVPVGEYEILVERRGFEPVRLRAVVEEGRPAVVAELAFKEKPGTLSVTSDPAGAEVFVDGRGVGRTPLVLTPVPPGAKKVRLTHPDALDWEGEVRVVSEEKAEVKAPLVRSGKLTVEAHPEGARVSGALEGVTRAQGKLKVGEHRVKVQHPEAGEVERTVHVRPGEETNEIVDLWEERAREAEKAGSLDKAAGAYEKARKETREKALARLFEACVGEAAERMKAQKWKEARELADVALKIRSGDARARAIVSDAGYHEAIGAAEEAFRLEEWTRARREAERAGLLRRGDRRAGEIASASRVGEELAKAREAEAAGRWDAAKATYEGVRALRPGNADAEEGLRRVAVLEWKESPVLPGFILCVAFSPSGKLLAMGGVDKTVRLWDVEGAKFVRALAGHGGAVTSVSFHADGDTLASASQDGTVRLWSASAGRLTATLDGHSGPVWAVAFSSDGKSLASGGEDRMVRLWNPAEGKEKGSWAAHDAPVLSVAFSPAGKHLASAGRDGRVRLWEAEGGKAVHTFTGHSAAVYHLAFSPDGKRIVSGSGDKSVRLWDVDEGKELRTFEGHTQGVFQVAYRPDGRLIASTAGDKTIRLWHADSGREVRLLSAHTSEVWSAAFSPAGDVLMSAGTDGVRRWSR
jgi:hypothetical protein